MPWTHYLHHFHMSSSQDGPTSQNKASSHEYFLAGKYWIGVLIHLSINNHVNCPLLCRFCEWLRNDTVILLAYRYMFYIPKCLYEHVLNGFISHKNMKLHCRSLFGMVLHYMYRPWDSWACYSMLMKFTHCMRCTWHLVRRIWHKDLGHFP